MVNVFQGICPFIQTAEFIGILLLFSHLVISDICNPMDYITPGFPVLHPLPELPQTHVH